MGYSTPARFLVLIKMKKDRSYRASNIPESAQCVFEGEIFDVYQWEQELYDGSTATFEKLTRADTAVVFPILEDGRILLINEEQPGRTASHVAPSGRVEAGELPEQTARRELKEETGYEPEELILLYTHTPASKIDWVIYAYVGKQCKKVTEPTPEPGERIEPVPVSFEELLELVTQEHPSNQYGYFATMVYEALRDDKKMRILRELFAA